MSLTPAMLDAMVAAGCTAEQIAAVVKASLTDADDRIAQRRARDAERSARRRARSDVSEREWSTLRAVVFERDEYACVYCGSDVDLACDHVIPLVQGGKSTLCNLVTACRPCNSSKGGRTLEEWRP